jgi:hypothetical protein
MPCVPPAHADHEPRRQRREPSRRRCAISAVASAAATRRGSTRAGPAKLGSRSWQWAIATPALSWHLGNANPPRGACQNARLRCAANAIELDGGHCRSLEQGGYVAAPPAVLRNLTGPRARLGCVWAQTEVAGIRIRRPVDGKFEARLSQVLSRVTDLQTLLSGARPLCSIVAMRHALLVLRATRILYMRAYSCAGAGPLFFCRDIACVYQRSPTTMEICGAERQRSDRYTDAYVRPTHYNDTPVQTI